MTYKKESDLCADFIKSLPEGWTAYPETGGFDILLSRKADGFQIGVEAKLKLNGKVISQAADHVGAWYSCYAGPDCRAVLVPYGTGNDLLHVCGLLGIVVIKMQAASEWRRRASFYPELPRFESDYSSREWFEFFPHKRIELPAYVPDVTAGASGPSSLTYWKISAIKLAITMEKRGYITRSDFKHFDISISRWIAPVSGWLQAGAQAGQWVKGAHLPDFRAQHPVNYAQIEADYEDWKNPK